MSVISDEIDALVAAAKRLPEARQKLVVDALREMVEEPYILSDAELAILLPALEDARAGRELTDAASDDLLSQPWS